MLNFDLQWQLKDKNSDNAYLINKNSIIIGRSVNCDIILGHPSISSNHVSLSVDGDGKVTIGLLDKNSYLDINGQKIAQILLNEGDEIKIGDLEFIFCSITDEKTLTNIIATVEEDTLSNYLNSLSKNPSPSTSKTGISKNKKRNDNEIIQQKVISLEEAAPQIIFSEYLYEDKENLTPVFKFLKDSTSLEATTYFNEHILSVNYLPIQNGQYYLAPNRSRNKIKVFNKPKVRKEKFAVFEDDQLKVFKPDSFDALLISPYQREPIILKSSHLLTSKDVLYYQSKDYKIAIRKVPTPPQTITPPFWGRDKKLPYIIIPFFLLAIIMQFLIFNIKIDQEKIADKAPDRIAQILYHPPKTLKKIEGPKNIPLDSKEKKKEEVPEKKKAPQKQKAKTPKKVKASKVVKKERPQKNTQEAVKKTPRYNFSNRFSNLLNKKSAVATGKSNTAAGAISGAENIDNSDVQGLNDLKKASGINAPRLTGGRSSSQESYGSEGIVDKKSIHLSDIGHKTVILGSIDPLVVKRIIQENIPKMGYCFDKELANNSSAFAKNAIVEFTIGASGTTSSIKINYKEKGLSAKAHQCLLKVISSMVFPKPKGGGIVKVKQPINFTN